MNEMFLHYLWKFQLFTGKLQTTSGENLYILHPGKPNPNSGPDFFNGRIRIDNTTWAGNIEIHVHSSDWEKHNHHLDPAYENIILHVVWKDDAPLYRKAGEILPTLQLDGRFDPEMYNTYLSFLQSGSWIPCENQVASIRHIKKFSWLERLMVERLEEKTRMVDIELANTGLDFQEIFYRKLARSFGFHTNGDAFENLAITLPLNILVKHRNDLFQMEALLYGQAGMLQRSFKDDYPNELKKEYHYLATKYNLEPLSARSWKFMRMRPSNFPTIRISQFAQIIQKSSGFLNEVLESSRLTNAIQFLDVKASSYWNRHFIFDKLSRQSPKKLGRSSIESILINTVIPFLFVYGRHKEDAELEQKALIWLENIKAERNVITKKFIRLGFEAANAMHTQAMIQLKKQYCDQKLCLECGIGHALLRSEKSDKDSL